MFNFMNKIIDFLNQLIDKMNYSDLEELGFLKSIVDIVRAILHWINDIAFAPLGLQWIFPVLFIMLFMEFKFRASKRSFFGGLQ